MLKGLIKKLLPLSLLLLITDKNIKVSDNKDINKENPDNEDSLNIPSVGYDIIKIIKDGEIDTGQDTLDNNLENSI